ncbi:hypothetical protein [Streptomyces virginiae]|uniref:Uncharacterized protein n=1 Tax=Streptomyces virginiae TaxID=1961 RepID=A0ABZ1TQ46_STRVG|nr:hypothetical protein [Streptomyces virginiae]
MRARWRPVVGGRGRKEAASSTGITVDEAPVEALRGVQSAEHVWQVSVRNHPDAPVLFDDRWAQVAAAMVHAAGIAERGDEHACRWIAVRHATDHTHIVASLARQDGRHPACAATSPRCTPPPAHRGGGEGGPPQPR